MKQACVRFETPWGQNAIDQATLLMPAGLWRDRSPGDTRSRPKQGGSTLPARRALLGPSGVDMSLGVAPAGGILVAADTDLLEGVDALVHEFSIHHVAPRFATMRCLAAARVSIG